MAVLRLSPLGASVVEVQAGITEEQFRRLAASLSSIVWRTNFDGTRLTAPRWAEITGTPEVDLHRGGWLRTVHIDDRIPLGDALRSARVHGTHCEMEFRLRLRDGAYHWFRARGEPSRDTRGEITGLIGIASNIDQQKRAEASLVDSETRLGLILDAAGVGTIDHDLIADRVTCGPRARGVLGLPAGVEVTRQLVWDRVHPEDRALVKHAVDAGRLPSGNGKFDVAFRVLHWKGEIVWISIRGTYRFEGTGDARRAVRFVGVVTDVTGRMRELEERARLSAIVSSSNDAILSITTDGLVTHWNGPAERMYGYPAAEMLGRSIFCTVPLELVEESRARIQAVAEGSAVTGLLTERITKDGKRLNVSITLSSILDDLGNCTGVSAIVRDVTRQTQLQAEFVQAQKMEAIGQLAGGVAHDLNNLLTSMLLGIECACESSSVSDEARSHFSAVRAEGFRAADLIRQLLTVARRQVTNPRPADLGDVVRETLPMLRGALGADIEISTALRGTRGAYVDPAQIGQLLLNLAINSRDAMPGGGLLKISTEDGPDEESIQLRVTDSGCGMTPDVKEHLFEPFFTTKGGAGTGLGLSAVYGIVAQSRGTIAVESEPGVGTTVTTSFPAIEAPAVLKHTSQTWNRSLMPAEAAGGDETILVVEDDRVVRDGIASGLERIGYTVLEAQNARDALIILRERSASVRLVVSDLVMPGMNGADLIAHVRAKFPTIRTLLMSGYSERALDSFGVSIASTALVAKPFELASLAGRIREELDRA